MKKELSIKLEGMGFKEKPDKKGLYHKLHSDGTNMYWDYRKTERGRFYVSGNDNVMMPDNMAHELDEYLFIRDPDFKSGKQIHENNQWTNPKQEGMVLRGNETSIIDVVKQRNLEIIKSISSDGKGEGILYYDLKKLGMEPSVALIDMITLQMGGIQIQLLECNKISHIDPSTDEQYDTYQATVRATDTQTGTQGLGVAEEIIDYKEMKTGRTFSRTKAIRKAERNAKERMIPVPRKALVQLIIEMMSDKKT